ncbi:hypothetical protein BH11PLA2_BH11PLA2_25180 [soil metagenome]
MNTKPITLRIDQLPLWRLLVALDDAERVSGPNSSTTRTLANELRRRLNAMPAAPATEQAKGAARG